MLRGGVPNSETGGDSLFDSSQSYVPFRIPSDSLLGRVQRTRLVSVSSLVQVPSRSHGHSEGFFQGRSPGTWRVCGLFAGRYGDSVSGAGTSWRTPTADHSGF